MFDAELYRDKAEVEEWKKRDPLLLLQEAEVVDAAGFAAIDADVLAGDRGRRGVCRGGHVGADRAPDPRRVHASAGGSP
jgi:hypothetical protein